MGASRTALPQRDYSVWMEPNISECPSAVWCTVARFTSAALLIVIHSFPRGDPSAKERASNIPLGVVLSTVEGFVRVRFLLG